MALRLFIPTLVVLTNGVFTLGAQLPQECNSYTSFSNTDRHISSPDQSLTDHALSTGWYRFTGNAGSYMPESCPENNRCGAPYPGWLNGIHPTTAEGAVTRTVCYHHSTSCCHYTNTIQVRNCGDFYVYYLSGTPVVHERYCGTDVVPSIPAECTPSGYNIVNETNRYWIYDDNSNKLYCDQNIITSYRWYRITGEAGTMIAPYCIPKQTCNTDMAGWISGDHPSDEAYKMVSRSVCMHYDTSCCYTSYPIEIRNSNVSAE